MGTFLLLDSIILYKGGRIFMANPNKYIATKEDVLAFLSDLREILLSDNYDLDILLRKKKEKPDDEYTTENTLLSLNFDTEDVRDELLSLTEKEYLETIKDFKDPANFYPFWVFGKVIQSRDVYIKVKIRSKKTNKVFCISFHFARYPFNEMPYK